MNIQLLRLFNRLSPSKQRLIREMLWSLAQLEQLAIPEDHDSRLDYESHIEPWLQHLVAQGMSHHTIRHYHRQTRHLIQQHPHPKRIDIEAALAELTAKGRTPGTIAFAVSALKSFFGYLADRDIITTDPAAKIHPPRQPKTIRQAPPSEHVTVLLNIPKSLTHQTMLVLLIDCGLRANELATLRISNTNTDRHLITVIGKGNKARQVPLSATTERLLNNHIANLRSIGYTDDWMFPGKNPGAHITTDTIHTLLERLCKKVNLPRISPHQLRHYFATQMLSRGASLKATSTILGHAQTSTTANIYWHIIDQQEIIDQHARYSPLNEGSR